jgi:hypothetical protein
MKSMDAEEFVSKLRLAAEQTAVRSVLSALEEPAGREPEIRITELSAWLADQGSRDREMLARAVALAAEQAIYNVLLVLDGLLAIESTRDKGSLELFYVHETGRTRLNDPEGDELSALF